LSMHRCLVVLCIVCTAVSMPVNITDPGGPLVCKATTKAVSDQWCTANCNHIPVNCPPDECKCTAAPPAPPGPPTPPSGFKGPIFELDLFVNDPKSGWQPSGWPEYLQTSAANYTNVAGISFIQPADLMNDSYDLPTQVGNAVRMLRKQGIAVQLLVGGEISQGWGDLSANPEKAAANALVLMKKYDCGIEVDCEGGGDAAGIIKFIQLCAKSKPDSTYMSMDVAGTPKGTQRTVIAGAIDQLDWVNLMVSAPAYDQGNSVHFGHQYGIPYDKMTVAYYAGTWVDNCNTVGSGSGTLGAGLALFDEYALKGLSIWAVGGMSYVNCGTKDAPGFAETLRRLKGAPPAPPTPPTPPAPPTPPSPGPPTPPAPPSPPTPSGSCAPIWGQCGGGSGWAGPTCCLGNCTCSGSGSYSQCKPATGQWRC